jgi:hypothetical protein
VVEAKDIIPFIVIGGLILLGLSRARAPEEKVVLPPPEEKPPIPPPPPYPPILAEELPPPEEIIVPPPEEVQPAPPYPIEFLLPPRRVEVMPVAVLSPAVLSPPPEIIVPPPPPEEPRVIRETEFYIFEERRFPQPQPPLGILEIVPISVREWEIVTDVYPLGSEEVTIAISDNRTLKIRLVSYRAPPGYVVTSWGSSGSWDTGDYQAWITIGVKQLYGW